MGVFQVAFVAGTAVDSRQSDTAAAWLLKQASINATQARVTRWSAVQTSAFRTSPIFTTPAAIEPTDSCIKPNISIEPDNLNLRVKAPRPRIKVPARTLRPPAAIQSPRPPNMLTKVTTCRDDQPLSNHRISSPVTAEPNNIAAAIVATI